VGNLQNQLFSLVGLGLFALGLLMVNKYFLNYSWRMMMIITTVFLVSIDAALTFITIYDVVRNQYFFLGESVLTSIPEAMQFVVSTFVIVEMASDGTEGVVYGLLTTAHNLGGPIGRAIGNQVYSNFHPAIDKSENYIADTDNFRHTVAWTYVLSYSVDLASLLWLFYLPNQKRETQEWKRTLPKAAHYAWFILILLTLGFIYSLTVNMMNMDKDTQCLRFVGGHGCENR